MDAFMFLMVLVTLTVTFIGGAYIGEHLLRIDPESVVWTPGDYQRHFKAWFTDPATSCVIGLTRQGYIKVIDPEFKTVTVLMPAEESTTVFGTALMGGVPSFALSNAKKIWHPLRGTTLLVAYPPQCMLE